MLTEVPYEELSQRVRDMLKEDGKVKDIAKYIYVVYRIENGEDSENESKTHTVSSSDSK